MATQQNNGGRIYTSKPAETTYQGAARSIGFNPVKAANSEKAMKQYKAAIVADGETMTRELLRQQEAENLALKAQDQADAGKMKMEQLGESSEQKLDHQFDRDILKQEHTYKKGVMDLEMAHLKASHSVANARHKAVSTAINGLLSFAGSALKYSSQMHALEEQQAAEKAAQMETDALNNSFFGDNFYGPTEAEVEETNAAGDVINAGLQAESTALGEAAADVRSTGSAFDQYEAEQIESMSSWNQLASVRGNVFEAKMMYPAYLAEARASGLIRPGAQGMQDIQNLNRKFAQATGLTNAALADPKFVADNFTRAAQGIAMNTLTSIASESAGEIKAAREAKVESNVAANFSGLGPQSTVGEIGVAFDAAQREVINGKFGGAPSRAATFSTLKSVAKELSDSGRVAELIKLKSHAPNPNTPNLTLGKQYGDYIDQQVLRARNQARTQYNLGKGERNMQAEQIVNQYWENPSPDNLRQTEARLRALNTDASRRLADKLVQNGYNYDASVARDIANKRGTADEYSLQQIQDLGSKGIINEKELNTAIKYAPDSQTQAQIKEAIKLYKPGKSLTENVVAADGGRAFPYQTKYASPAFKQELRMKESRFNIELGRRLQGVLRDNPGLEVESQEFQDIVKKESDYLMKQERFQISYKSGQGYSFGQDPVQSPDFLEKLTIAPGKQTFYGLSATNVVKTAGIPKAMIDPTVDQIMTPEEIEADSQALLDGGKVSKRTNDWAHALGMSQKDFVNSQRLEKGLPNIDQLKQEVYAGGDQVSYYKGASPGGDIKDHREGMRALQALGMPTRGAAYMSSAIKHESNWHGTRQWGEVAGDGTNRNGGLLSWASWAGNSARLGNIERYFGGRNIAQISEQEQLQFLMHELKTSYPDSYRVFMNPNASSTDLQWATWNYIRWDKRYTGNRWTVAESLIRWGTANP